MSALAQVIPDDPTGRPAPALVRAGVPSWQLWLLAFFLMLLAASWQRRSGPSYPARGTVTSPSGAVQYRLPRSHVTGSGAVVSVPAVRPGGALLWRRYPTAEPFRAIPLQRQGKALVATLPPQPPAGKVEYYLELSDGAGAVRVPAREAVVLRYRAPVPLAVLLPHVLMMFLSMLVAVRAAMGALARRHEPRLPWEALFGFTVGGLVLGPVVQKYAFGAYWTGVPFGWDLTDNKTLVMWAIWLLACVLPLRWPRTRRTLVLAAAVVTVIVYVIPHSMHGSQLDYRGRADAVTAAAVRGGH